MIDTIIKGLFSLVAKLGDIVLLPIITLVSALIPDFANFYQSILNFLGRGFTYIGFFMKVLCIPPDCMTLVYTIAVTSLAITLGVRVFALIVKIYNKFKL